MNPSKQVRLGDRFQSMIAENPELKLLAQKAFVSYVRSVCLQPNKEVFQPTALPLAELATAFGLSSAPRVRFLEKLQSREELKRQRMQKMEKEKAQQFARSLEAAMATTSDTSTPAPKQTLSKRSTRKIKTRERQLFAGEAQVAEARATLAALDGQGDDAGVDSEHELLVPKSEASQEARRAWLDEEISDDPDQDEVLQRKRLARKAMRNLRRSANVGTKKIFDEEGNVVTQSFAEMAQVRPDKNVGKEKIFAFAQKMSKKLREADALDRETHRQRVRLKRQRQKEREREEEEDTSDSESGTHGQVVLAKIGDDDDDDTHYRGDDEVVLPKPFTKRGRAVPERTAAAQTAKSRSSAAEKRSSPKTTRAAKKKRRKKANKPTSAPASIAEAEQLVLKLIGH